MPIETLRERAERIVSELGSQVDVDIVESEAFIGGGSVPAQAIASVAVRIRPRVFNEVALAAALRSARPAVIGRRAEGAVWLDMRTVLPAQDDALVRALQNALPGPAEAPRG